jgi:hypothetical protein
VSGRAGESQKAASSLSPLDLMPAVSYNMPVLNWKQSRPPWRRLDSRPNDRSRSGRPYPPYVTTEADRRRWDLSEQAARRVAANIGGDEATIWLATRSLYRSDIPTDD